MPAITPARSDTSSARCVIDCTMWTCSPESVRSLNFPPAIRLAIVAAAGDQANRGLGRLHAPARPVLRHARVARQRRPMEHRPVRRAAMLEDSVLLHLQVLVGRVEVVVLHRYLAGGKQLGLAVLGDHVRRSADPETKRSAGDGVEAVVVVGHDQRVAVGRVLEEIVPAFLFHQAGGEVQ